MMPDKEKVIKGLESQLDDLAKYADSDEVLTLTQGQAKALLVLLKEQEGIESIDFGDRTEIMANLEGLTWDDWRMYHSDTEVQNIAKSAFDLLIALLKKQEAVEPIPPTDESDMWECGNCNHQLFRCTHQRYCEMCGKEVKWDDSD